VLLLPFLQKLPWGLWVNEVNTRWGVCHRRLLLLLPLLLPMLLLELI
jgi:hypothetical protein